MWLISCTNHVLLKLTWTDTRKRVVSVHAVKVEIDAQPRSRAKGRGEKPPIFMNWSYISQLGNRTAAITVAHREACTSSRIPRNKKGVSVGLLVEQLIVSRCCRSWIDGRN